MNHTTSAPGARPVGPPSRLFLGPGRCRIPRSLVRAHANLLATLLAVATLTGCRAEEAKDRPGAESQRPIVILVSFDGFRWDYPDRGVSPNLEALKRRGVRAEGLIPSFPTKTFPNHYTLVTGLTPGHHGIVANNMYDPDLERSFSLADRDEVRSPEWWGGVPLWVTAERSGCPTAPFFWPGSEAPIEGVSPTHWRPWEAGVTHVERVRWVLDRLDLPPPERPCFLTLYFDDTDIVGHNYGPDSKEILDAILRVDADLGLLLDGLEERGLADSVNIIVVSDHGMSATSPERVIFVDDYVDLETANPVDWNPVLALWPDSADVTAVYEALREAHPNLAVFLRDSIPERFQYGTGPRIAPILGVADAGWMISTRPYFESASAVAGNHGYDPEARDMWGIFVAAGPAFVEGLETPAIRNVDIYPLLMDILGLPASPSDGDLQEVAGILAR